MKTAFVTGVTGQDGSYLAEFLLDKGYEVHGLKRRSSSFNTGRIEGIFKDPHDQNSNFHLHHGDLLDTGSLTKLISQIKPDEIYNLGAQSHVAVSFELPEYTANVNALGTLRVLEAVRSAGLGGRTRIYQASSSEMFGKVQEIPQSERTPFYPCSPYGVSKLFAYWITKNYRESYGIYACNGILFNHESPRRGETFVTRKITRGLANIAVGAEDCLYLGNLDALRDWGHARDYVRMQWLMLQQAFAKDYVIATGHQLTVRDFLTRAAGQLGVELCFEGRGIEEVGRVMSVRSDWREHMSEGKIVVRIDPRYYRPCEVDSLLGDSTLAFRELGWEPRMSTDELIAEMVQEDLGIAIRNRELSRHLEKKFFHPVS